MKLTICYFNGCPHWEVARDRVDKAILLSRRRDVTVEFELIETPEAAEAAHFIGSPTLLVNGRDPFDPGGVVYGLSCRRYNTEAGMEGAPSVSQLVKVLAGKEYIAVTPCRTTASYGVRDVGGSDSGQPRLGIAFRKTDHGCAN